MKVLTSHQNQYYGYLGLYDKIMSADQFCIFDDVQFTPKDFISRNRIRTPEGWTWLTVPTKNKGHREKTIKDIEIADQNWQRKHLKTIQQHYRNAKYYHKYSDWLEETYSREWTHIAELDTHTLLFALERLGIDIPIVKASDYQFKGTKSELVLDMCKQLGADKYIFGPMGKDYADVEAFNRAGIEVEFQSFTHPEYNQCFNQGFVENLAVLDFLMNEVG